MFTRLIGLLALMAFAGGLFAQVPQQLYYKFNEGAGTTTANDASPGAGTPTMTLNTGNSWQATGQLNAAMNFSGTGSNMATGYAANFTNNDSFTVEFWIRGAATSTLGYITGDTTSGSLRVFTGGVAGTGGIVWRGTGWTDCGVTVGVFDGTWHHVAYVFDGTAKTMTMYLDGVQAAQNVSQTSAAITGTAWYVGGYSATTAPHIGDMDEFRFWNVARSQAEIQANMNVELSGTIPTLNPAVGSGFNGLRQYDAYIGVPLSNATLVADDGNDPNINITVTPVTPAPGVTAPASQAGAPVPFNLDWTGTPTTVGAYTYDVQLSDGTNNPTFTVTINVTDPGPTLDVPVGSVFNASYDYTTTIGVALANTTLEANDLNSANINITVTPVNPCPGVTAPSSQVGAPVPATLTWTGTPSGVGSFTYDITLFDGTTSVVETVTLNVNLPGVLLGTQGTGNSFPFNYSVGNGRFQTAYGPTELNMAPGSVITEVRVAGSIVSVPEYGNLRCRMGHTTLAVNALNADFDLNYTGTLSTVLGPVNFTPGTAPISASVQWYVFPLAAPFVYNGVDGLLIDWSYDSRSATGFTISTTTPAGEQARSRVYLNGGSSVSTPGTAATTGGNYGIQLKVLNPNSVAITTSGAAGGLATPQTDVVVMDMSAMAVTTPRDLNSVTFSQIGTISDAAISNVKLVRDNNGDGLVDAGDTTLGSGVLAAGQVTFSGAPLLSVPEVSISGPVPLLLAVTIPGTLTSGTTVQFEIPTAAQASWSGSTDLTAYPLQSGVSVQRMAGTYTINQTSGDFLSIGAAFDALETVGVSGPVILEVTDSATYVSNSSYSLGLDAGFAALAPVAGASNTNTITLRAATGQTPVVQGNAAGAGLIGYTARGGIGIMQSFVIVEGLEVTGGPNFGILIQGNGLSSVGLSPTDNVVRRCRVHDIPSGPGIGYFGQNSAYFTNGVIENNFVWNCHTTSVPATSVIQGSTATAGCIAVRNPASGSGSIRHNTILHTSGVANTAGMAFSAASTTYALNDVNNNIVVVTNPSRHALWLNSATHASVVTSWDFNYWFATLHCNQTTLSTFATWQTGGRDVNGSNADPELINTAGTINLHLLPTSPCVDPAGQTSTVAIDIDGDVRPQGTSTDIGADEGNFPPQLWLLTSSAAPASVTTGLAGDQWLGSFRALSVNSAQQVSIATFSQTGSAPNTGFTNLKLWVDNNANNQWDAGDIQIAGPVATMTGSTVTFAGLPPFAVNQLALVFITGELATASVPGTARFEVTSSGDVSSNPGPITGNFPLQGAVVNVNNPAPTLAPSVGSGFNASRVYNALSGVALSAADLVADDPNAATLDITVTPVTPAPGVTAPSSQTGVAIPATLSWSGTPTTPGSYTYDVTLNDGFNTPTLTVTINVTNPPPTLTPAVGSGFSALRVYNAVSGVALVSADLVADDVNATTVDITVTPVTPAPGVTAPSSQTGATVPATLSWTGTPTTPGSYSWDVTLSDGVNNPTYTVTINVSNPAPTLSPAAGSGFNASRIYNATSGVALTAADLVADDSNDPTISVTITPVTPAPGVTQPANQLNVTPPVTLSWTGTPTTTGSFTYDVTISDGTNSPTYAVTIIVTNPAPTLNPAAGSGFNASRVYSGAQGTALSVADLVANDANDPLISITVTPVTPAPGVTAPASQVNVATPVTLSWTGTPTSAGSFTYDVQVSDGVNSPTFTVTLNILFAGTITINQTSGDFLSIGAAFDAIESVGLAGAVILEITDSATYTADASYTIGMNNTGTVVAIPGLSAANSITLRAATGQTPKVQGSATGAVLQSPLTGRGCIGIMSSYTIVEGIECFGGPNFGILIQGNSTGLRPINNEIRRCIVHDIPDGPGIAYMGQNSSYFENGVIENNFVWNCFTNSGNPTTSTVLLNNTGGSITVRNPHNGTGVVRHNTIVHTSTFATTGGIYTYSSSTAAAMNDVNNNIVVCTDPAVPAFASATSDTNLPNPANCNHNYWFATTHCNRASVATFALWQTSGRDTNGSNANPQLNSTTAPFNLHLLPNSPCIDPSTQNSTATVDIDGDTRPIGPVADIGADEANVPFMAITQGVNPVNPASIFTAGLVPTTTGMAVTFTINNQGVSDLLLTGGTPVVATILNNLDPASGVQTQPALTTIPAAGNTTFVVFLDPTIPGNFSMSISIDNNDLDRNPYSFTIDGTAFTPNGEAQANTAIGSSLSGGTNGPFTIAVDPGTVLANVEIELTDPETDTITVNSITLLTGAPTGITAPAVPAPGQPILLAWTGTADASNAPGAYTWQVSFADAVNQTVITADVTITINNLAPQHVIAAATGGNGSGANPYTVLYTETMTTTSDVDIATVTDPNTSQVLALGTVTPGGSNPVGGNGFTFSVAGGFLNVAPTSSLVAADVGVHTFDVDVTDGSLVTTIAVSITVAAAPAYVTVSPLTDGEQGIAYSFQLVVNGGTPALAFTLASGTLPPGVGLNASGLLSGTPTLAGVYAFDVTATDSLGVGVTGSFQITVDPPATGNPTITTTSPLPTGTQDAVYAAVTITATGGTGTYSFAVTGGTLPPGLSLSAAGVVSGTPTLAGTYAFDITVTDTAFATDTDAFQVVIDPPPVVGGSGGGGGGGGGGCVTAETGTGPWLLLALIGTLLIVLRLRKAHE
ncbi:MAG: putative Ig domain-containing protein [Planctomycetes bacterium]|nr:putative Ig domain-containing protein [Planctomycetota bacterium]